MSNTLESLRADAEEIVARYPDFPRSALGTSIRELSISQSDVSAANRSDGSWLRAVIRSS